MSGNEERTLIPAVAPGEISTFYTRLGALSNEDKDKGFLVALEEGASLAGVLENIGIDKYKKNSYAIKRADGKTQVINQAGNLAKQLATVAVGTYVDIRYNGMNTMTTGEWAGNKAHNFTVLKEEI